MSSRARAARRAGRSALCAADLGRRHHAHHDLRAKRSDRPALRAVRNQGRLHAVGHRRGADVRRPAVRGADGAAGAAGSRSRTGGGGGDAGRLAAADLPARDRSGAAAGDDHRLRAGLCARAGRIRIGRFHFGQHADAYRGRSAADHDQARAVRLPGRDRDRGSDAGAFVHDALRDQPAAALERARAMLPVERREAMRPHDVATRLRRPVAEATANCAARPRIRPGRGG